LPAQIDGGPKALVGVGRRHAHVGDHDVRCRRGHGRHELVGGAEGGHDLVAVLGQDAAEPFP